MLRLKLAQSSYIEVLDTVASYVLKWVNIDFQLQYAATMWE